MDGMEIKSKIREFVINFFDGFDQFKNNENLVDMGIVTDDFVLALINFIETTFNVKVSEEDVFENKELSINSAGNLIEQIMEVEQEKIERVKEVIYNQN